MSLLPTEERLRWMLVAAARLVRGGAEPVSGLVLPNGKFFPDAFDGSPRAVGRLLRRIVKHAGLSDLPVKAHLVVPEGEALSGGGCSTGACGVGSADAGKVARVEERADGWTLNVTASEVRNPTQLTTAMVRGVSHIFLREAGLYGEIDRHQAEGAVDLTGVLLGFGVLLANGAYIYAKG